MAFKYIATNHWLNMDLVLWADIMLSNTKWLVVLRTADGRTIQVSSSNTYAEARAQLMEFIKA